MAINLKKKERKRQCVPFATNFDVTIPKGLTITQAIKEKGR